MVCCSDGKIRNWDLGTGAEPPELLSETSSNHVGIMFSAHQVSNDKTMLFTADVEGYVKVWDLRGDLPKGTAPPGLRRNSIVPRPGKPTQVDHWKTGRRAVNMIGYVERSQKSPAMLVTASGGQEVSFWTLDGVKVGAIGDATPVLWDTMDKNTWDGHQEKAQDSEQGAVVEEEEEEVQMIIRPSAADRRKAVKDAVVTIFEQKKLKKNNFKVTRTMNALKIHSERQRPLDVQYRHGTGPDQLQQLEIGKPRYKKKA